MIHVAVAPVSVLLQRALCVKLDACGSYVSQQVDSQDLADILKVNARLQASGSAFTWRQLHWLSAGRELLFGNANC